MDDVGTLKACRHDFHVSCIRKWLSMKNLCPICKKAAVDEEKWVMIYINFCCTYLFQFIPQNWGNDEWWCLRRHLKANAVSMCCIYSSFFWFSCSYRLYFWIMILRMDIIAKLKDWNYHLEPAVVYTCLRLIVKILCKFD